MRIFSLCAFMLLLAVLGCGTADFESTSTSESVGMPSMASSPAASAAVKANSQSGSLPIGKLAMAEPVTSRRVIYQANLELEVDDLETSVDSIRSLIDRSGGYTSNFYQRQQIGDLKSVAWEFRVPVERFESLIAEISNIGAIGSKRVTSKDVTEEFVDLAARLANKRATEKRLQDYFDTHVDSIDDAMMAEQEIDRVREVIERIEGRQTYLAERTNFSEVELQIRSRRPEQLAIVPTFGERIHDAATTSWANCLSLLTGSAVVLAWLAPWSLILIPAGLTIWLGHLRRKSLAAGNSPS